VKARKHTSRRQFLAASSNLVLAGSIVGQDAKHTTGNDSSRLALLGGQKTVPEPVPHLIRWGEPERERLNAMLGQDSLFYWKGKQTTLLIDRFLPPKALRHQRVILRCPSMATPCFRSTPSSPAAGP
jgi:perosamine synthetase